MGESDGAQGCDADRVAALLVATSQPVSQFLDLLHRETTSSPEMRELTKEIKEGRAASHR